VVNLRMMPSMTSIAEHSGALAELRQAGLVRHLGVSGVTPRQLAEAQASAPVVLTSLASLTYPKRTAQRGNQMVS
jgi:pyridoxine 4-dehydrogenase